MHSSRITNSDHTKDIHPSWQTTKLRFCYILTSVTAARTAQTWKKYGVTKCIFVSGTAWFHYYSSTMHQQVTGWKWHVSTLKMLTINFYVASGVKINFNFCSGASWWQLNCCSNRICLWSKGNNFLLLSYFNRSEAQNFF